MYHEVGAGVFDCRGWFFFACGLAFDLDSVFKWVRFAVAGEFNSTISQKLKSNDVTERVVLILNVNNDLVKLAFVWRHLLFFHFAFEHCFFNY